jgi:methylated-DNA-[protein]-cysteine S-methyltransferase
MILKGTKFQMKVWKFLKTIPKGTVTTYSKVAEAIGHPKAVRAVANAIGNNPYPIIIPCHRVVRANATIGGYSGIGGIKKKKALLRKENIKLNQLLKYVN